MKSQLAVDASVFSSHRRLTNVRVFVDLCYSQPISLADAANVAGMESTYFSKYFHRRTGVCFHDWLSSVRVQHARSLLKAENLSLTEVATRVGFGSLRSFERSFQRHHGCTPRAFKRTVQPKYH